MVDKVYMRRAPPYPFGSTARERPRKFLLYVGVDAENLGTHEGQAYLIEAAPFDPALALELPAPPYPFGVSTRRAPRTITSQGASATIWPAVTGNAERSTLPTDTPADIYVPGLLGGSFNYEISLFGGADPTTPGTATIGLLDLHDASGLKDDLLPLGWDGAPILLRRGDPEALFATYATVAKLTAAGLRYSMRQKQIVLRDLAWTLQQAELHGHRYAGTGGIEGDARLTGIIKPYCIGVCRNIPPTLIVATLLIYQVSCSSVLAIDAVYDGRVPIAFGTVDYATYAELAAATVAPATYATCNALGLFRLGSSPVFIVTADVRGDNDTIAGLSYPHTRAQVARRIATGRGLIRLSDPQQIDGTAYAELEQRQTETVGYFWNEEITKAAALTEVMAGCLGWWTMRLDGRLAIGQLEDPAGTSAHLTLSYPADGNTTESRLDEPVMQDSAPPRRTTLMGWARNYTRMSADQIAGSVSQFESAIYQADTRFTTSDDLWVAAGYPTAQVVSVNGGFDEEAAAQREGDRQSRLLRTRREAFEIPAVIDPFADVVGRVISIANCGRIGLGSSRNFFCFGVSVNANQKPVLRLWS